VEDDAIAVVAVTVERGERKRVSGLIDTDLEFWFQRGLRAYLGEVARALGLGLESCTVDVDVPVSAYLAVDWRLRRFPDRDVALLWDEVHGWAVAVEAACGEEMIVLAYLGGADILPEPRVIVRFLGALRAGAQVPDGPGSPVLRRAGRHQELLPLLPAR
jgi:Family of unknown function (DUF6292)